MGTPFFASWNPNACDDQLVLLESNTIVTTNANGLTNARKVLGTLPIGAGLVSSEHEFWSVPEVNLGTNVAIGIAQPSSALNTAPGADSLSVGFYPATGDLKTNGSVITNLGIIPERTVISIIVSLLTTPTLVIGIAGTWAYSYVLPSSKLWVLAAMLAGGNAGETSLYSKFGGARGFEYTTLITPPV